MVCYMSVVGDDEMEIKRWRWNGINDCGDDGVWGII